MTPKFKYYYLIRPNLDTHLQFYLGWVREAQRRNISMKLIVFLPLRYYVKNYNKVKKAKKEQFVIIIPVIARMSNTITFLYFAFQLLISKKVIIHLRKAKLSPVLKNVFSRKLFIVKDFEGDPKLELEYLIENPYKKNFYRKQINSLQQALYHQHESISNCDLVMCVNDNLRSLMVSRYPDQSHKFRVLPTGVDLTRFYFNEEERNSLREKLGINDKFVFIFAGNLFYSWQNISKTLKIFKEFKADKPDSFFILLTSERDMDIASEFIESIGIQSDSFILDNVPNSEVRNYLNASDIGILLRDNHEMNKVAEPGKIGEYVACGLPIIITESTTINSKRIESSGQALTINPKDDIKVITVHIKLFLENLGRVNTIKRASFAKENAIYFANNEFGETYKQLLESLTK